MRPTAKISCRRSSWRCGARSPGSGGRRRCARSCCGWHTTARSASRCGGAASKICPRSVSTPDRLFHAIRTLPEAQRQAVMLYLEGLSQREIAELQETSDNNVAVRLTRARKALRTLLVEEER
ncbi:MAG: hypothetical protein DMD67_02640 [Gemmatimonadetes bacterium]|nr:MAG: hypothetical protein DMD67_02640 [Gemmatimonadota bacterium]